MLKSRTLERVVSDFFTAALFIVVLVESAIELVRNKVSNLPRTILSEVNHSSTMPRVFMLVVAGLVLAQMAAGQTRGRSRNRPPWKSNERNSCIIQSLHYL